jgi:hypothetical protein
MILDEPPAFWQQFCTVTQVTAGGNLNIRPRRAVFGVQVADGQLFVIEAPAVPVFRIPVSAVKIAAPGSRREIGAGSFLRIDGQLWSVQFGSVYQAEAARAGKHRVLRAFFRAGAPGKSIRRGREINQRFVAALLDAGAVDETR